MTTTAKTLCLAALLWTVFALASCDSQSAGEALRSTPSEPTTLVPIDFRPEDIVTGQTVYVPIYSQIYRITQRGNVDLTATLSIRNIDRNVPLILKSVAYFDTQGIRIREYLDTAVRLGPLATAHFVIEESDRAGGPGANFLVEWVATEPVAEPIAEAIMIGQIGTQGVSFVSSGRVSEPWRPESMSKP